MDHDLKRGFRSLVSAKVLASVIGVVALPFVVRVLGSDGYGDYAFLMSTFSMLMLFVSPLVTEGVQKFVAEDRARDDWQAQVLAFYLRLALVAALLGSLLVATITWTGAIERVLEPRFTVFFYFLAALVVVIQLQMFTRHALLGLGLEHFSESFSVGKKLGSRVGGLALAAVGFGVAGFLAANIVTSFLVAVAGFVVLRRRVSVREVFRATPDVPTRKLLSFNGLNVVTVMLMMSLSHVDVIMVRLFRDGAAAGHYKAALVVAEYLWLVPMALQSLLLHSGSRLWSQGKTDRIEQLTSDLTRYVFLATSLLAIGIYVLADRVVPLYFGAEFTATVEPLALLLPGVVGFALARPIYAVNKASGRLGLLVGALGVAAVFNLAANAVLIPRYGLSGAAVATSASYGSMFLLQAWCAHELGYSPVQSVRPGRALVTVLVSLGVIAAVDAAIRSDYVALAVVPAVGAVVFTAVALSTGAIDRSELGLVTSLLPAPLAERVRSIAARVR